MAEIPNDSGLRKENHSGDLILTVAYEDHVYIDETSFIIEREDGFIIISDGDEEIARQGVD